MDEKIPFIHLMESPNGKYFYDVNTNEIVPISKAAYVVLGKIMNKQTVTISDDVKQEIVELESQGYLSDRKVTTIKHWASEFLEPIMTRKLSKITLQLTQNCNLRCAYCAYTSSEGGIQRAHSTKRMSFETAKKGVDFLLEHSIDSERINIAFYGGEPLLEFNLLKDIVAYVEENAVGRDFSFSITTNCTMVTEEIITYFIEHNIIMSVSLDGPKGVHDDNRRFANSGAGSFDKVIATLKGIYDKHPDYFEKMLTSMVIDSKNSFDYINSVFSDYEFLKKMILLPTLIDDTYSEEKAIYSEDFSKEYEYKYFLGFLNRFERLDENHISPIITRNISVFEDKKDKFEPLIHLYEQASPGGPCIAGQLRLFMDVNGNFFPCERVSETAECMKIGNVEEGIDLDKVDKLINIGRLTAGSCRNCWAFLQCSICAKQAVDENGVSAEFKLSHCNDVRRSFDFFLHYMILSREIQEIYR